MSDDDAAAENDRPQWRIDDLARLTSQTVDTIRYYQKEGLLPRPERLGRTKVYGPDHLVRLEQIRALQARRFSLAAIRALLDADVPSVVEGIFLASQDRNFDGPALSERTGADEQMLADLSRTGALQDPAEGGREAYDSVDVDMVNTAMDLERLGLPRPVLLAVLRVYVEGFEEMQGRIVTILSGADPDVDVGTDVQLEIAPKVTELVSAAERLLRLLHQRSLQRWTMAAVLAEELEEPPPA